MRLLSGIFGGEDDPITTTTIGCQEVGGGEESVVAGDWGSWRAGELYPDAESASSIGGREVEDDPAFGGWELPEHGR